MMEYKNGDILLIGKEYVVIIAVDTTHKSYFIQYEDPIGSIAYKSFEEETMLMVAQHTIFESYYVE